MMDNFRTKLLSCTDRMKDISLMRGQSSEVDAEAKNRNTFFDSLTRFITIMNSLHCTKCFNDFSLTAESKELMKKCWENISNTFETEKITNPVTFRNDVNKLEGLIGDLWKCYISGKDLEMLDMLEIFAQVCNNKKEIQDIVVSIRGLNTWPINDSLVQRYNNRIKQGKKKIEENHFDHEIEVFLRKVKEKQASLLDLNPTILKWIQDNDLGKNISLSIRMY